MVTSATSGQPVDPDGYTIVVDQGAPEAIAANATVTISDLAAGDHRVQITGIAPHCSLGGANPQTVNVASAGLAHVTFQIACTTPTGGIEVTTTTAGESLDPDGFSIQLDGQASQPIGTSETKTFAGVTAGAHTLELTGASRTAVLAATTRARWWSTPASFKPRSMSAVRGR